MPVTIQPQMVKDDSGNLKNLHMDAASGERCNLDAARAAGNLSTISWPEAFALLRERKAEELRDLICDYCFVLMP